jgi:RecA/RadA recombinase
MSKFDFSTTINKIQNTLKKDERRANQFGVGSSLAKVSNDPKDYVVMPQWWKDHFGILGIRFGNFVQIAGDPDSGKTTLSLLSIKCAQEQGYGVIYVETEGKTGEDDLIAAGIDPKGVITVHTKITEEMYDGMNLAIEAFFAQFPGEKLLVVIDSYGNSLSMRDSTIELVESNAMVGGAAKTNRTGISALAAKQITDPIAVLVVNYTYDNMGSPGKTNAGGKALDFHCMLTLQSQRTGWYEKTVDSEKVRAGAFVKWRVYKNHYAKSLKDEAGNQILLPKEINLKISGDGIEVISPKNK